MTAQFLFDSVLWSVAASDYAPAPGVSAPTLTVTVDDQRPNFFQLTITLTDALWPGTSIAADFTFSCEWAFDPVLDVSPDSLSLLWMGGGGIGIGYQGGIAEYPTTGIVLGELTLPAATVSALGASGSLAYAAGTAAIGFKPGMLQVSGTAVLAIAGFGAPLSGDAMTVEVTTDFEPYFDQEPPLGSLLLVSTNGSWVPPLPTEAIGLGPLSAIAPGFNSFTTATGLLASGESVQQYAFFSTVGTDVQFSLALDASVAAPVGPPPVIGFWNPELVFDLGNPTRPVGLNAEGTAVGDGFWAGGDGLWVFMPATPTGLDGSGGFFSMLTDASKTGWYSAGDLPYTRITYALGNATLLPIQRTMRFTAQLEYQDEDVILVGANIDTTRVSIFEPLLNLLRPADLMVVSLQYQGMVLSSRPNSIPALVIVQTGTYGTLVATLQPQHVAETVVEPAASLPASPIAVRMAGPSRLAFLMPSSTLAYIDLLLDWSALIPIVVGDDGSPNPLNPVMPGPTQTALELPYRLTVSPGTAAGWSASVAPTPDEGAAALWHLRLAARANGSAGPFLDERPTAINRAAMRMAAVWSPDWPNALPDALDGPLDAAERNVIVGNFAESGKSGVVALNVDHCLLSALGASADFAVDWTDEANGIAAWRHVTSLGRDQYVRVVRRGHLFPWGHACAWVQVSERRFDGTVDNTARLFETEYVVVAQPVDDYARLVASPAGGRDLPFTRLEVVTLTTPPLQTFETAVIAGDETSGSAWIALPDNSPFQFQFRGYDRDVSAAPDGNPIHFAAPAIFIGGIGPSALVRRAEARPVRPADALDDVTTAAQSAFDPVLTAQPAALGGQALAFAAQSLPGDTTHPTAALTLLTGDPRAWGGGSWFDPQGEPLFYPTMSSALVSLPAAQELAGVTAGNVAISYAQIYLQSEFANNTSELYAQLVAPLAATFAGAQANGLVAADMQLSALSRGFGLLPGTATSIASIAAGSLNPADFLQDSANLVGIFNLKTLLTEVIDLATAAGDHIPGFRTEQDDTAVTLTFDWTCDNVPSLPIATFDGGTGTFTLHIQLVQPLAPTGQIPAAPVATTLATLSGFSLNFAGLVTIGFAGLTYNSVTGAKPQVSVPLSGITLSGDIDFLEPIVEAGQALLGEVPAIDIQPDHIGVSQDVGLPEIAFGVFDLSNIRVNTGLVLSLQSDPMTLDFGFSDRNHPFTLAIDLIGGGGWFHIAFAGTAVSEIDFAVQAGAYASLDLGVASGSVSIMLGIAFTYTGSDTDALTGYVRVCGEVTVLQLVSVSVEIYLGLTYEPAQGRIWGEADFTVEVSVAFFSKSFTLTMRKEFPVMIPNVLAARRPDVERIAPDDGVPSATPPKVIDVMPQPAMWAAYAGAFS
ncbi:MAG TPA: hypothetical protein VII18_00645 [Mycobacterium sp.]